MAFIWNPAALQHEIITYSPGIQIDEMRDNADLLDGTICSIDNSTVHANYCYDYDSARQNVNDGAVDVGVNAAYNAKV